MLAVRLVSTCCLKAENHAADMICVRVVVKASALRKDIRKTMMEYWLAQPLPRRPTPRGGRHMSHSSSFQAIAALTFQLHCGQ